jgi:hypothetical protein
LEKNHGRRVLLPLIHFPKSLSLSTSSTFPKFSLTSSPSPEDYELILEEPEPQKQVEKRKVYTAFFFPMRLLVGFGTALICAFLSACACLVVINSILNFYEKCESKVEAVFVCSERKECRRYNNLQFILQAFSKQLETLTNSGIILASSTISIEQFESIISEIQTSSSMVENCIVPFLFYRILFYFILFFNTLHTCLKS